MSIGQTIRAARKSRRLTQERLAAEAHCSCSTIARIERGEVLPSIATTAQIARALHLPELELLGAVSEETSRAKRVA